MVVFIVVSGHILSGLQKTEHMSDLTIKWETNYKGFTMKSHL